MLQRAGDRLARVAVLAAVLIGVACALPAGGALATTPATPDWGTIVQLPGLSGLAGVSAAPPTVGEVCVNADRCMASGSYGTSSLRFFVDEKVAGVWGTASDVPGLAAFVGHDGVAGGQIACFTVHLCLTVATDDHGMVVVEDDLGTWSRPLRLRSAIALAPQGGAPALPACSSPGNCVVGGAYARGGRPHAWMASQRGGSWGVATEVPGVARLEGPHGGSFLTKLACPTNGNCVGIGAYETNVTLNHALPFLVVESRGRWAAARSLPRVNQLAGGHVAMLQQVACPATADCTVAGYLLTSPLRFQYFADTERSGRWLAPVELGRPSTTGDDTPVVDLQCPTAERCTMAAQRDTTGGSEVFAVMLLGGVPGGVTSLADALQGSLPGPDALSCPSAAVCGLAIAYAAPSGGTQVATATEENQRWSPATSATQFDPGGALQALGDDHRVPVGHLLRAHRAGGVGELDLLVRLALTQAPRPWARSWPGFEATGRNTCATIRPSGVTEFDRHRTPS